MRDLARAAAALIWVASIVLALLMSVVAYFKGEWLWYGVCMSWWASGMFTAFVMDRAVD
jgi:hypothetical protein